MENPRYATVKDFLTIGDQIVTAHRYPKFGLALTGLLVDLPEDYDWKPLDALEGGYDRITVYTTSGVKAFMYAYPGTRNDKEPKENHYWQEKSQ